MSPRNKYRVRTAVILLLILTASTAFAKEPESSFVMRFYRNIISPVDGDRCPMTPSCSTYAQTAFKKHGPIIGWIMTCDRLMRCGRDCRKYCPVKVSDGNALYYDPVESNDFWWFVQKTGSK